MARRPFFCDRVSSVATGRKLLAEHLIAKGMLKPEAMSVPVKVRGAGAPSAVAWKAGWREVGDQRIYARSAWEANFSRYLEWLRSLGEIAAWRHEKVTFWFEAIKRGVRSYLPDFEVTENSGSLTFYEVKGHMDSRSKTKIKRMAKYHPSVKLVVIGRKEYGALARKVGGLIAGWE